MISFQLAPTKQQIYVSSNGEKPEDFQSKLMEVLAEELNLSSPEDQFGFNRTLGASLYRGNSYFWPSSVAKHYDSDAAVKHVENWQIP